MKKRAAVVDAAARLFRERPDVEAVGVDEVAALAGVSKATLYRYFPSKAALVQAAAERAGVEASAWEVPDRRTQILQAALRLIPARGLRSLTMEQIAEAAGISPAAIYWHFGSKDDLVVAVAEYCSPVPVVKRALARGAAGDPYDDLREFARQMLEHAPGRFEVMVACVADSWSSPRVATHVMRTVALPRWGEVRTYFAAQTAAGRLRKAHFLPRMMALAGPIMGYLMARRALSGVASAVGAEDVAAGALELASAAPAGGAGPFGAMLAMLATAGDDEADVGELTPEELVETHVRTFLAGHATPAYLAELEARSAHVGGKT
ncbi:MAG TPA: helix-turn-helix domain-containing protein [Chloroflexota bacterium]|nr:helix-turn-helix domain-containing protein [Chloroflexota bacterium]